MDAVSDPAINEIWVMKSAQVGWTEILGNVIAFHIDQDPAPILLVQPTLEMGEAWSKDRLAPMLRDTPRLRGKVSDPRSRDSGNTLRHKEFPGGHLTIAGANAPSGLAQRPIRILCCDDVDRYPASAGAEGDPLSLARKRMTTFWNSMMLAGSTPTVKGTSRIESGFEGSDQRFYFVPCPHCEEFQRLIWAQVQWEEGRPETAAYACKHCGAVISHRDKADMLRRGEWRATKQTLGIAGFHISELYSPWVTWAEMASAFLEAKKLPETLQTWINTALGETWEERGQTVEPIGLMARRELYGPDGIPQGVVLLTLGVDVQDNRLELDLVGWGKDEESWVVHHHALPGDPGGTQLWRELDEYIGRRYVTDDGRTLWVEATGVDSGGHYTQQVYRYCVERKRWRVWALKGQAGPGRLAWPKRASKSKQSRADVFVIGVDTIKDLLYARLARIIAPGPGYVHFAADLDEEWFEQFTSETKVYKQLQGRRIGLWRPKKTGSRQEAQDCWIYAYAVMLGRGVDLGRRADAVAALPPRDMTEAKKALREPPVKPTARTRRVRSRGVD